MFTARNSFFVFFLNLSTARSCNFLFHNTEVTHVIQLICLLIKLLKEKKATIIGAETNSSRGNVGL